MPAASGCLPGAVLLGRDSLPCRIPLTAFFRCLHALGWSVGDVGFHEADARMVWLLTATRGLQVVSAKGGTQLEVWREAVRLVARVGRDG